MHDLQLTTAAATAACWLGHPMKTLAHLLLSKASTTCLPSMVAKLVCSASTEQFLRLLKLAREEDHL
jgi:hypothetical protein